MTYTVNKTNSSSSPNQYTVQDGVVNTQTDLSFIGKGYAGYGESIAENFLHLLENFSNTSGIQYHEGPMSKVYPFALNFLALPPTLEFFSSI